jgi:hypothetical protein
MSSGRIRVGIIGAGGWAKYGHIPALQALKGEFKIVAVASRRKELKLKSTRRSSTFCMLSMTLKRLSTALMSILLWC